MPFEPSNNLNIEWNPDYIKLIKVIISEPTVYQVKLSCITDTVYTGCKLRLLDFN